ncbi:MAG TPA: alpha/beta hydrolase [Acidimicrobiales bacterium]|nr:alpha/beta hydrolase [Acidimicrobiales bacterium]
MTTTAPRPPELDAEAGRIWRMISASVFEGGGIRVDADTLETARGYELTSRDSLLSDRPYTERTVSIPGPAGPMSLSVFTPERHDAPAPALYWIHGGGMVLGTRYDAGEALEVATTAGAVVASIEYRLAPEHPAPAPGDDCYAGLLWLAEHAGELGVDPARIVLGGTSAGGGLSAATALRVRDHGGPPLAGVLLCCPMLDDRMATVSANQFGDDIVWTHASNDFGWHALLGDRAGTERVTVYEVPGRATDLSGLPPTYIDVGSADIFRDEDAAFASTIWACGGDAELHVWPGGYHGFELLAPAAALSRDAFEARRRWIARVVAPRSS